MNVVDEIAAERRRQQEVEGWTAEHDDSHSEGDLALAAACYSAHSTGRAVTAIERNPWWNIWPWDLAQWKPKNPRRDLIRAAALIVAEIERLDRQPDAEARRFAWTETNPEAR